MLHIETLKALLENLNQQPQSKKVGIKFVTCWLKLILDEYEVEADCPEFVANRCRCGDWCLTCERWKK